jgi:histidinol dehydrogenase
VNEVKEVKQVNEVNDEDLDEYNMDVDNLEETNLQLEELGIYEVYELINTKIKENIIQNIRNILINKKIKTKLDLAEMINDEDEEE